MQGDRCRDVRDSYNACPRSQSVGTASDRRVDGVRWLDAACRSWIERPSRDRVWPIGPVSSRRSGRTVHLQMSTAVSNLASRAHFQREACGRWINERPGARMKCLGRFTFGRCALRRPTNSRLYPFIYAAEKPTVQGQSRIVTAVIACRSGAAGHEPHRRWSRRRQPHPLYAIHPSACAAGELGLRPGV
jgi:hypothetical protein